MKLADKDNELVSRLNHDELSNGEVVTQSIGTSG